MDSHVMYTKGSNRPKCPKRQLELAFEDEGTMKESQKERCLRLLASLGQPAEKLERGNLFDYAEATAIAKGQHMQTVCITGVTP